MKPLYLFSDGRLQRKDNTLLFVTSDGVKKTIPINAIDEIQVFGEIELNKRALEFLSQNKVPIFFYNHYGYYVGSYYPREYMNAGIITLHQARCYLQEDERLFLARSFVEGAIKNILKNLAYYKKQQRALSPFIETIEELAKELPKRENVPSIMALEAEVRKIYYESFDEILQNEDFAFDKRTKRPPQNALNALISFGNTLLYNTILAQIYRTHLDPRIGYLHETNERSFSLNLDIAEIFKPIIVDRVIFSLINRGQMQLKHFEKDIGYSYLNEKGRKIFIQAYEEKLKTTITHPTLGKVSYRRAMRLECYKLYKHFLLEEPYKPFVSRW